MCMYRRMNQEDEYTFNNDPAIKDFTWDELLEYNIKFLKGEKKTTFYHASPLVADQVPEDLIELHKLGVFTIDGQGVEKRHKCYTPDKPDDKPHCYAYQQRAYLTGLMPISAAKKIIKEAKKDKDVYFELTVIIDRTILYLSKEIGNLWKVGHPIIMTRHKEVAGNIHDLIKATWKGLTANPEHMAMLYELEDQQFKHWDKWLAEDELCYFFIVDAKFGQEPKSMAKRVVEYLTKAPGIDVSKFKDSDYTSPLPTDFDNDIDDATWQELLEYNIEFFFGYKKHPNHPFSQDADHLIKLHENGVLTVLGKPKIDLLTRKQRECIIGYMPRKIADKFIKEAKKDTEVYFEVSSIQNSTPIYLSPEMSNNQEIYVSLTRTKTTKGNLSSWSDESAVREPLAMLYEMANRKFNNWDKWVAEDELCYFFIIDAKYEQEPKPMAKRIVEYLTKAPEGGKRKSRKQQKRSVKTRRNRK